MIKINVCKSDDNKHSIRARSESFGLEYVYMSGSTRMVRILLIAIIFLISTSTFAASWKESFFTDDSNYYLKLYKNGFKQRFRISKDECEEIESAKIIFKTRDDGRSVSFTRLSVSSRGVNWPNLFGINEQKHCWFQVEALGIDLNAPLKNKYVIRIDESNGRVSYFTGINDSIIPSNRLIDSINDNNFNWIDLGAQGATTVVDGGVFFKVWEPSAEEVHLRIDGIEELQFLREDHPKGNNLRNHVIYLPNVSKNSTYHYLFKKNGKYDSSDLPDQFIGKSNKIDPMSKGLHYDKRGGKFNAFINPRSVVTEYPSFAWKNDQYFELFSNEEWDNWLIYQIWPLTFNSNLDANGRYLHGTFE